MTKIEQAYFDMQRLAFLLLTRLGGEVTLTDLDMTSSDWYGKGIQVSEPDPLNHEVKVRIVEYPKEG